MARRKKAPEGFHKKQIAAAAGKLFMEKGIERTSMNDIVKESGYGKATLYVYFKNKDEIVGMLALESMKKLLKCIQAVMNKDETAEQQYVDICKEVVSFQKNFPDYFLIAISNINVDLESDNILETEKETFMIGEQINYELAKLMKRGIEKGELKEDLLLPQTIFTLWAAISGIITMSDNKNAYIKKTMDMDRNQLLEYSFKLLFEALKKGAL